MTTTTTTTTAETNTIKMDQKRQLYQISLLSSLIWGVIAVFCGNIVGLYFRSTFFPRIYFNSLALTPWHDSSIINIPTRPSMPPSFVTILQQSSLSSTKAKDQSEFQEFLVQPAMLAHPNPKQIAIWATSTTLAHALVRQVRMHSTVQDIHVFLSHPHQQNHSDDDVVEHEENSANNIPSLPTPTCSSSETPQAFPRIHFSSQQHISNTELSTMFNHSLDVIIVQDGMDHPTTLWSKALDQDHGIFVSSMNSKNVATMERIDWIQSTLVQAARFPQVTNYDWTTSTGKRYHYAIAFTKRSAYAHWHLNPADFAYRIRQRQSQSQSNQPQPSMTTSTLPLTHPPQWIAFDSAAMSTLRFPTKHTELYFCRYMPQECADDIGVNPNVNNIPRSQLVVKRSGAGEHAGRGVYTLVDIEPYSYIDLESSSHPVRLAWKGTEILWRLMENNPLYEMKGEVLFHYIEGYGFADEPWVRTSKNTICWEARSMKHCHENGKSLSFFICSPLQFLLARLC